MSSVVLWLSSFTGVHFLPVVSVSISPSCSGATADMCFPFLALFLPVANKSTVTNSQVGWASLRMWQFSRRFSLYRSTKSFCSPLIGDFEICKHVGEALRTGELSTVSRFTSERFAVPLAGMWMQPQSQQTEDVIAESTKTRQSIFTGNVLLCRPAHRLEGTSFLGKTAHLKSAPLLDQLQVWRCTTLKEMQTFQHYYLLTEISIFVQGTKCLVFDKFILPITLTKTWKWKQSITPVSMLT